MNGADYSDILRGVALQIGIVGLPNVGKSTLFNALTRSRKANVANFPFCTIDPNVGIVEVPDERLAVLAQLVNPQRIIPAAVEFVDIAGLVKGASSGEGLGNKFLSHIRECDAIAEVIRVFEDENIIHVHGDVVPKRDIEIIESELILADLDTVSRKLEDAKNTAKSGNAKAAATANVFQGLKKHLESGKLAVHFVPREDQRSDVRDLHLLTNKGFLYIANVHESEISVCEIPGLRALLGVGEKAEVVPISAKIEEELSQLAPQEAAVFLADLGLKEPGLTSLIKAAYRLLGYQTYFTAGPKEVRAWTISRGAKAAQAAGVIHTDFEKGFIAAEVTSYADYVTCGGEQGAKEKGKLRVEGREYVVQDGDVMHFRFNV